MGFFNWFRNLIYSTPSRNDISGIKGRTSSTFYSEGIGDNETIFACVTMLANGLASAPVTLRQGYSKVKSKDHPLARLFRDGPNVNMSMFTFVKTLETIRNIKGRAYAIKEYNDNFDIQSLWILNSDFVYPVIDTETKELWYMISTDNGDSYVHNRHVLSFEHISADGYKGISPLDVLKNTLKYDRQIKQISIDQLEDNLNVKYKFKVGSNLDSKKIKDYWTLISEYIDKGVIFLDTGKDLEEMKTSSIVDPKIFDVEQITVEKIGRVFNIPQIKLNFSNKSSSTLNAEQINLEFLMSTLLPNVRMYEQEFSKKCLTENDKDEDFEVKFNLNGFARADMGTRGEYYFKAVRSAWLTPNEIRELEDIPPMANGDELMCSRDMIKISDLPLLLNNMKGGEGIE